MTKYRADTTMRNGENSFLNRWGHIKIDKIFEPNVQENYKFKLIFNFLFIKKIDLKIKYNLILQKIKYEIKIFC